MKKLLALIAFSVLLLVPVGAQQVFENHPNLPCLPPGILNTNPDVIEDFAFALGSNFCYADLGLTAVQNCPPGYLLGIIHDQIGATSFHACVALPDSFPDTTLTTQCQGAAVLISNHCFAEIMAMVGGALLSIDTTAVLVAAIGTDPVITGLVAITMAGVAGQAAWFIHRRKKNSLLSKY